ncbi:MAG: hypothetical protein Q4C55_06565 [Eubacterium sp.]|nr:hypothetical protein [Eubacterium sp.]
MGETTYWEYEEFEFDNRVTNLMWTVCGDYTAQMALSEKTAMSKNIALYYGITAGGRRKHVDWELVDAYVRWRRQDGFLRDKLQTLIYLGINPMVINRLMAERPGIADIQRRSCREMTALLGGPRSQSFLDQVEFEVLQCLGEGKSLGDAPIQDFAKALLQGAEAGDTQGFLEAMDRLYLSWQGLSGVRRINWQAVLAQGEPARRSTSEFVEKTLSGLLERSGGRQNNTPEEGGAASAAGVIHLDPEQVENMNKQVAHYRGSAYIEAYQNRKIEARLCKGPHLDCKLHFTDGVLRSDCDGEFQKKYALRDYEANRKAYQENLLVYTRTIKQLRDGLIRTLVAEREKNPVAADAGAVDARKVWRVGRTPCARIFKRYESNDKGGYVVDLMLDASTSQKGREKLVAIQAYIVARALIEAGIPCRVTGFNSFLDYTVLKRFRDYDDHLEATDHIFEYYCESSNRDGLAIKAVTDTLYGRTEDNKILIVLSDGKPNDIHLERRDDRRVFRGERAYSGGTALGDTAKEVRIARQRGVSVLGVFTGDEKELEAEKLIYGKDFIYTREIRHFADIVMTYLKRVITS